MKTFIAAIVSILVFGQAAFADVVIKSGATTDQMTVNTNKAALTQLGNSARATYIVSVATQATATATNLSIESSAGTGFKIAKICAGSSVATAAAAVTVTLQRRTSASSGGTALTAEGTSGTAVISKMDPADGNFGGVGRLNGSLGTAGAILDQWGFTVAELGAGAADTGSPPILCLDYTGDGQKMPVVAAGTANGVTIGMTAAGSGGLAAGFISAVIIAE